MTVTDPWRAVALRDMIDVNAPQRQRLTTAIADQGQISVGFVYMPAGHRAAAHVHWHYDIIVAMLEGNAITLLGDDLEDVIFHKPGDTVLIPAGVPHVAVNLSPSRRVIVVESRADPKFNDDVELLPHLEARAETLTNHYQQQFVEPERPRHLLDLL